MEGRKREMDLLQHFSHEHLLLFVQDHSRANEEEEAFCHCCGKRVDGPSYCCSELCKFSLHKRCAELELAPHINHPFHPKHPLTLIPKPTYGRYSCNYCRRSNLGFNYRCVSCDFDLDVNCALFQPSITENFSSCLHDHPSILIENHKEEVNDDCRACKKPLSGPIYKCLDCLSFYFHKECGEASQINHPYDRIHPLSPLINATAAHQKECSCYLCKIKWDGLVYCCSICNIQLTLEDVTAPRTITAASHEHPWTLLKCAIPFTCQFCGIDGDRTPYICTTCDLIVHKKCVSLPRTIKIARHPHQISHVYSLKQKQLEELECKICHEKVNARYGSYGCSACNYIAHVNCATDKEIWDGTVVLEDDEKSKGVVDSGNMITDVISEETVGEDVMATKIKHAYHHHNLILTFRGGMKVDNICDGCMRLISTLYYTCQECRFSLHKSCAELPREKGLAIHKHLLKLSDNYDPFWCKACGRYRHGFSYNCDRQDCYNGYKIDVQCSLLPDTLMHPSHEHSLFLFHNYQGRCSGYCGNRWSRPAYRCTQRCEFAVDLHCLTLARTAGYKYDKHPLTLTYYDSSDPTQLYCDICEKKRDSKQWFYNCARCDILYINNVLLGNSLSSSLGQLAIIMGINTLSLLSITFGTVLCVMSAVNFAIDRRFNVKNLDATLRSTGIADIENLLLISV